MDCNFDATLKRTFKAARIGFYLGPALEIMICNEDSAPRLVATFERKLQCFALGNAAEVEAMSPRHLEVQLLDFPELIFFDQSPLIHPTSIEMLVQNTAVVQPVCNAV